jgi:hypothetical protein
VIHEGLGGSFQRLPLLGVGLPDGSVELLCGSYNGDGERQVLAQALGDRCSLSDLAGDQLRLAPEDEANDPLGFLQRRDVFGEVFEVETARSRGRESSRPGAA